MSRRPPTHARFKPLPRGGARKLSTKSSTQTRVRGIGQKSIRGPRRLGGNQTPGHPSTGQSECKHGQCMRLRRHRCGSPQVGPTDPPKNGRPPRLMRTDAAAGQDQSAQVIHSQPRDPKTVQILARAPWADNEILSPGGDSSTPSGATRYLDLVPSWAQRGKNAQPSAAPSAAPSRKRAGSACRNCAVDPTGRIR
jgi:hypothetical protein